MKNKLLQILLDNFRYSDEFSTKYITKVSNEITEELFGINSDLTLADELKIEWFKNNFDKIDPLKDL